MATDVIMPALGMAQETGILVQWLKSEGEPVAKGEPLMEVETDKATVELEAPASGVLANVTAKVGDEVPVGQVIALVLAPGESPPEVAEAPAAPAAAPAAEPAPAEAAPAPAREVSAPAPEGQRVEGRPLASPKARRLAAERGVDLTAVGAAGSEGVVRASDVLATTAPLAEPATAAPGETLPLSNIWRLMAERMISSWTTAPHFYLMREVDAGGMADARRSLTEAVEKETGVRPTYTDLLTKLVATVLRNHPRANATWTGAGVRVNSEINIGIATATEEGLIVPVIHNADALSIGEIAVRRSELVERAGAARFRPDDLTGATFTISNLGMYGVDAFNAVVNPPEAAILAVGRITDRVVPVNGQPTVRPQMVLSLSCDHRVIDGVRGAQFLDELAKLIEEPSGVLA